MPITSHHVARRLGVVLACGSMLVPAISARQASQFQFVVAASDASGLPVTDLKPDDVIYTESGARGKIVKLEPYPVPVKLTVAVDNGVDSREALGHYRTGLTGLVEALPQDMEITLISTAPQPRTLVRAATDRTRILRAVTSFAPEDERPRFTDVIVEFSKQLEREVNAKKAFTYIPILLMVSTTANEVSDYQLPEVEKALKMLVARRARLMVTMTSTKTGDIAAVADINTNRQAMIAIPATKATGGRYEALAVSSRLATLLPEMGQEIRALHLKHGNQVRVTVERPNGLTGPIQSLQVEIGRQGLKGSVSIDGLQ
jgi:hypothetical protein